MKIGISKEIRFTLFFILTLALVVVLSLPQPPLTSQEAQHLVYQRIQQHCKDMSYNPCDYKLVKVERFSTEGSGIYIFNSMHRKPISVSLFENGEIHLLDDSFYSHQDKGKR